VLLDASVASGVTGVNLYWSTSSGVSATNGTKIIVGSSPQAHTGLKPSTTYYYVVTAVNAGGESAASAQVSATTPAPATTFAVDPLLGDQWHIQNGGQKGGTAGEDLHVVPVWTGVTVPAVEILGAGVRVAVVDNSLEIAHEDLATNMASNELSINYLTGSNDPTADAADTAEGNAHGTAVAGIIAARGFNGIGVSGVAPRANLVGYNLLKNFTLSNVADAMIRGIADVHVSNNSWGVNTGDGQLTSKYSFFQDAIETGLTTGRGGKGTIYVFSAGNGAPEANANYKVTTINHGIMAVGAVDDKGVKATYSEEGANLWVSAPGGEFCDTHTITTTDRTGNAGYNLNATTTDYTEKNYTQCMNGTSAAAPGVSGVIALMLEARPDLGWRDVKIILAETSRMNDQAGGGWFANGGSPLQYGFSHKYGFGVVDAAAAVARAKTWTPISTKQLVQITAAATPNLAIPDATNASVSSTITVPVGSAITKIEFVEITFSAADHTYAGDLEVTLTGPASTANPNGTVSRLAETHKCMDTTSPTPLKVACSQPYDSWVFGSSAHLDETPVGDWTLTVTDKKALDTGTFQSWGLKFYGR
jgi:proprotein convertase subtilisin/kexin type 2